MNKLGIYFGTKKQEALLRGDTSNAVVNRYFVYAFQAIGMNIGGVPGELSTMVRLQARYAQKAWESLVEIHRTDDQKLKVQGLLFFVHSLVILGFTKGAPFYLLKVCEIVDKWGLRFLPVYGRPAKLSEQVREDAAVLSQVIYLENYFYLALGGLTPTVTVGIEKEFRLDLQVRIVRSFSL